MKRAGTRMPTRLSARPWRRLQPSWRAAAKKRLFAAVRANPAPIPREVIAEALRKAV